MSRLSIETRSHAKKPAGKDSQHDSQSERQLERNQKELHGEANLKFDLTNRITTFTYLHQLVKKFLKLKLWTILIGICHYSQLTDYPPMFN